VSLFHNIINVKRRNLFILLLLLFLCGSIRLINFAGIGINDDIPYIENAKILAAGHNSITDVFNQIGFRFGMVLPLTLITKIFGVNDIAYSLYPLICSLITCALIYLTALKLWGRPAAVFASLLWIFYPLQIVFDTQLSPSNQHATCIIAAFFLYFYVTHGKTSISSSGFDSSSRWRGPLLLILSGICLGFAWWVNEIFVTFIFVALPFLIIMRPKIKHLLWIFTGFLLIIFIELIIVKISSGSFFSRFTCILNTEAAVLSNKNLEYLPRTLFKLWHINFFQSEGRFGIIWYLFIVLTIMAVFMKDKIPLALALGCWLWLFYLQWGIQSPSGTPVAKYIRYISMIVPLQCLTFGAVLQHFTQYSKKLKVVIISLFLILLIHSYYLGAKVVDAEKIWTYDFKELAGFFLNLKGEDNNIIYADEMTGLFIGVFSKGRLNIQLIDYLKDRNTLPKEGFLVKDGSRRVFEIQDYRKTMPQWYLSPPGYWQLLYTVRGKEIPGSGYEVFDPKVYKILPFNLKGSNK
jgi:4-amino-4-deoxy-L-arabinose transferase-like glycosyltransferase